MKKTAVFHVIPTSLRGGIPTDQQLHWDFSPKTARNDNKNAHLFHLQFNLFALEPSQGLGGGHFTKLQIFSDIYL